MKSFLIFLSFFISASYGKAQHSFGIQGVTSFYSGDLANNPFDINEINFGVNAFYGKYFEDEEFQLKARLTYAKVSGKDENKSTSWRRNLRFSSPILALSVMGSYDILDLELDKFVPYVYGGLGVFTFNPKTDYEGEFIELQPLGTEGQGITGYSEKYALVEMTVPFGVGLKTQVSNHIVLDLDLGANKTFTDYLDDVSGYRYVAPSVLIQNGIEAVELSYRADELPGGRPYSDFEDPTIRDSDPRNISTKKDWFYTFGLGASYTINTRNRSLIPYNRKRVPNSYP